MQMRGLLDVEPSVRKVLEPFLGEVLSKQKNNVVKVVLFGSAAREDYTKDSDIDVFLLLKDNNAEIVKSIITDSFYVDLNYGDCETYISPFPYAVNDYQRWEKTGVPVILSNIEREGVTIYDSQR